MFPILTFIAIGAAGWFSPTPLYPDPKSLICSTNAAPIGAELQLYYDKTRRGTTCEVVGRIASNDQHLVNVSSGVRSALGFKNSTTIRVYRVISAAINCDTGPPPETCKAHPAVCLVHVPGPALSICI